jgi:ribonuclease-3
MMANTLESKIGYVFQDQGLLKRALRHSSAAKTPTESYERLEFLGDRVLGLVIADMLLEAFPDSDEGGLAKRFSALVCERTLKSIADELDLAPLISAERPNFAKERPSVAADVLEALVAAIYLEGGYQRARQTIESLWQGRLLTLEQAPKDPKSALQEWAHQKALPLPEYSLLDRSGPDHRPVFNVQVQVGTNYKTQGSGLSLRAAEKAAAQAALQCIIQDQD